MVNDDLVFKALADSSRRFLLDLLHKRDGQTLGELEWELEMTRFGVMKHLKVLEEAGLDRHAARRPRETAFPQCRAHPSHSRPLDRQIQGARTVRARGPQNHIGESQMPPVAQESLKPN